MRLPVSYLFLFIMLLGLYTSVNAQSNCQPCNTPNGRYIADIFPEKGIGRIANVYYNDSSALNPRYLDFYSYEDSCKHRPLVVFLPGSGFIDIGIDPRGLQSTIAKAIFFARKGFAVAVVDYRREPEPYTTPIKLNGIMHEAMQDVYSAIQFLVGSSELLRIDTSNIFIIGESAGGIAGLGAYFSNVDGHLIAEEIPSMISSENMALNIKSQFPDVTFTIKGFAGVSTAAPTESIVEKRQTNINLPMLFLHGSTDSIVPFGAGKPDFFKNALTQPLCGPECIINNIKKFKSSNCYMLNEVVDSAHDVISKPVGSQYLVEIRNFFYRQINCVPCVSYHNVYDVNKEDSIEKETPLSNLEAIEIYPNPAESFLVISGMIASEDGKISIYTISGELIHEERIINEIQRINITTIAKGIYVVKIKSKSKTRIEKVAFI